jgi:hypothetical protein
MSLINEKIAQASGILREAGVDCWLTFVRETGMNGDPVMPFLAPGHVTWQSAFIVTASGRALAIVGQYDKRTVEETGAYEKVEGYVQSVKAPLQETLKQLNPKTIAINYSEVSEVCDGLTHGMFLRLEGYLKEIGFETRCASISDITFRDCDVIRCEREGYYSGGVFTIHNGDRALVSNVRYEDIRVEDAREKLIDFKVLHSHYSKDAQRGQIRGVHLKDVHVVDGELPPSIIQSFDRDHRVEDVTIENLRFKGRKIENFLDARLIAERAVGVRFI